jgi:hypothetical protein
MEKYGVGGKPYYWKKNLSQYTFSTTNLTWPDLGQSGVLRGERPGRLAAWATVRLPVASIFNCTYLSAPLLFRFIVFL